MNRREFLKAGLRVGTGLAVSSLIGGAEVSSDRKGTLKDVRVEVDLREKFDDPKVRIQKLIDAVKADVVKKTRETTLPGTDKEDHRDPVFRFERGQIWNAYHYLRKWIEEDKMVGDDPSKWRDILKKLRVEAQKLEKQLDILNRQVIHPDQILTIDSPESGEHRVPVYKIDLRDPESTEPDTRVPYFYCGTYMSNVEHNAELLMALALDGHVVYTVPNPERLNVVSPDDWSERIAKDPSFKHHAAYYGAVMKRLFGDQEADLMGYSMGASVALEMASNPGDVKLRDVISMEPVGFENKGLFNTMWDFGISQGARKTIVNAEVRDKSFIAPWNERVGTKKGAAGAVNTLVSGKHFDAEKIAGSKLAGRLKIVLGEDSPISSPEIARDELETAHFLNESLPLNVYMMKNGHHGSPSVQTLGLMEAMKAEPTDIVTELDTNKLDNSAVLLLLRRLQRKSSP